MADHSLAEHMENERLEQQDESHGDGKCPHTCQCGYGMALVLGHTQQVEVLLIPTLNTVVS